MEKLKKILSPALGIIALIGAVLKIMRISDYDTTLTCLFLIGGLLLLAVEITTKTIRKAWQRLVLIVIPVLIVALAVQNLLIGGYSTSIVITICMYFMLSEQKMLSPKKS